VLIVLYKKVAINDCNLRETVATYGINNHNSNVILIPIRYFFNKIYDNLTYFHEIFFIFIMIFPMRYRRIFLDGYSYYITIVTYRREPLLVTYIDKLREAFMHSKKIYRYNIDAIVVLPDHLHMIITPKNALEYPEIIKQIKRSFVYNLPNSVKEHSKTHLTSSQYHRGDAGIWQGRYYEHTIRNEKDMIEKMQYIQNNPIKHGLCSHNEIWKHMRVGRNR